MRAFRGLPLKTGTQRATADKTSENSKQQASEKAPRKNGLVKAKKAIGTGEQMQRLLKKSHLADL